jgi:hypothetical protein
LSVTARGCNGSNHLTIAGDDQELVVLVDVMYLNVRESSDYLLLGRKIGALLELEVADGA